MAIVLDPPSLMTTERLTLRLPALTDARQLYDGYISKPEVPKYMSWVAHTDIGQTVGFLTHLISAFEQKTNFEYVIEITENSGAAIGMIGMHPLRNGVGFGYVIAPPYWNQGIASEALKHLVDWSLKQKGVFRAQAHCDTENPASARVMEKAGMSFEGVLRRYFVHPNISDEPRDSLMYAKAK
ncbi:GNAT family protein [uncultured Hoeflea sp.]|uniref:GNAT family N-acetyltransferase n=1 Tax=uncultured Hoeflea sp. TaxID=538666 RepID=UPI0030DB26FA